MDFKLTSIGNSYWKSRGPVKVSQLLASQQHYKRHLTGKLDRHSDRPSGKVQVRLTSGLLPHCRLQLWSALLKSKASKTRMGGGWGWRSNLPNLIHFRKTDAQINFIQSSVCRTNVKRTKMQSLTLIPQFLQIVFF